MAAAGQLPSGAVMNWLWDRKQQTIRGSAVCLAQTILVMFLVILGAFSDAVSMRLETMETLILGFFGISFTVWSGRKVAENWHGKRKPKKGFQDGVEE
jgi:hypothetical protein